MKKKTTLSTSQLTVENYGDECFLYDGLNHEIVTHLPKITTANKKSFIAKIRAYLKDFFSIEKGYDILHSNIL